MEYKDYYDIMGVARDASQDDIRKAYRKLARKFHPDVSKEVNAEERFKDLGEAYEVLKDPEKRAAYDQLGRQWQSGQDFRPPPGWDTGFEHRGAGNERGAEFGFSDFFEELFGRARHRGTGSPEGSGEFRARGEDRHARILVDLEASFRGGSRSISLQVPELTPDGHVTTRSRTLKVQIPKGIREGQQIRLAGQGGPGLGNAANGDLYLEVAFHAHDRYRLDGADLYADLPVAPWEAALGASVQFLTPGGNVELKIPAGSQAGRQMRLKGRGLPGKSPGDLFVVFKIVNPPVRTDHERAVFEQLRDSFDFNPRTAQKAENA